MKIYFSQQHLVTTAILVLGIAHSCQSAPGAEQESAARINQLKKARAVVTFLESELKTKLALHAREASSDAEVDRARAIVAKTRHDLALLENKHAEVAEQLRLLVAIRERELLRHQRLAESGFGSEHAMNVARRRLACCRFLLEQMEGEPGAALTQLGIVVELFKKEVARLAALRDDGAASVQELNQARRREISAQYLLACENDNPEVVVPQLRLSVELCKQEWDQIQQLRKHGAADLFDEYLAHGNFLNARLHLARLENEQDVVLDQLSELINIHEKTLSKLGGHWPESEIKMWIEWELARDRERMEQVLRDGSLKDGLSIAEIDP